MRFRSVPEHGFVPTQTNNKKREKKENKARRERPIPFGLRAELSI